MNNKIIIDSRENELIDKIKSTDINQEIINVQMLEIGDIQIIINDVCTYIIERKTHQDLASSNIDGRYRDQRERMIEYRKENSNVKIIYLIEGIKYNDIPGLPSNTARSIFVNMISRDSIFCYHVPNINESAKFICKLFTNTIQNQLKENKLKEKLNSEQHNEENTDEIIIPNTLKMNIAKNKNKSELKEKNTFTCMLAQIPSVSPSVAYAINLKYNSLPNLIKAYMNCTTEKENLLVGILCGNGRKIGKKISYVVYKELIGN